MASMAAGIATSAAGGLAKEGISGLIHNAKQHMRKKKRRHDQQWIYNHALNHTLPNYLTNQQWFDQAKKDGMKPRYLNILGNRLGVPNVAQQARRVQKGSGLLARRRRVTPRRRLLRSRAARRTVRRVARRVRARR